MKLPKILSAVATAAIMLATSVASVSAAPTTNFVEGVDWTKKVVTVIGEGIVPPGTRNYTQAKGLASRAAQADAYRKLSELINGVRVEGETTVEKMVVSQDVIKLRVSAIIKGAKIVDETFLSDGGYRVVMQVPLFGVSNSLANAVFDRDTTIEPFPNPVLDVAPSEVYSATSQPTESYVPVSPTLNQPPLARKSIPSVDSIIMQQLDANSLTIQDPLYQPVPKPVPVETPQTTYDSSTVNQVAKKSVEDYASFAEGSYTGLIVDCRGLGLQPVMSPVIKNVKGTKIYGHKNLDIDRVISEGMADYIDDIEYVDRAGSHPLVVKAVSLENFNSNPVLTVPDSNRVLIENHATQFLKELKVVFFFD